MKTALITGAAGDIGKEVAQRLDQLGYRLILIDLSQEDLVVLCNELNNAESVAIDLTDRDALNQLNTKLVEHWDPIDLAFINAGTLCVGEVLDLDTTQIDLQLELNLRSAIHLIKACATSMSSQGRGHIIATVSIGGIVALRGSATYSATKFGLRGFLCALRDELKPKGVTVSGIYPSGVDTKMLRYEAQNGGSPLNFLSLPQTVEAVGAAVVKLLQTKRLEVYIPYSEGLSSRFLAFLPWMMSYLYPLLEWFGKRGLKKYINSINSQS